ncbi:MAG: hypothetical protein FWF27_01010 [Candidatus Bathyarchaeota archaeon]|nr:hypothetical protein [Candidatus Termiticorpusculum sp.]
MSWKQEFIEQKNKKELVGYTCSLTKNASPRESNTKPDMYSIQIYIKELKDSFEVFCTRQDIALMVKAEKEAKPFTFNDDEYNSVSLAVAI